MNPPVDFKPIDDPDAEIARITRRCQGFKAELNAVQELRKQEKLRLIDLALDLTKSADPGHWGIAELIRAAIDKPGHPDDLNGCPCGGECGCEK
jgi:hypothetical protein